MGADGHIAIYDRAKFEEKFGTETVKQFLEHFSSARFYEQTLSGKEYLSWYWGDNLDYPDTLAVINESYRLDTDDFNTKSWQYSQWEAESFMKLAKEKRQKLFEMAQFLEAECKLTEWEVWT